MMNKDTDWVNHTFEFAVVLIGILIAFQLNRCSDNLSKVSLLKNHFDLVNWSSVEPKTKAAAEKYYASKYANTISTHWYLLTTKLRTYRSEAKLIEDYLAN
ncbi:MAG: hypothetical protein AAF985_27225 [Bacteroidota bacterium]